MKKSGFIGAVALLVAAVGVIIALAAYFKNRSNYLFDDDDDYLFDDPDDLEYYTSDFDEDDLDLTEDNAETETQPQPFDATEDTTEE